MTDFETAKGSASTMPRPSNIRVDQLLIADMVEPGSRVLDVGCGDGALLAYLAAERGVDGRGIELGQEGVKACVANGLSVVQGNADTDLVDYPSNGFDYAILSQTLQATHNPKEVLMELLRVGRRAIVSFPNFGFWKVRFDLLLHGRMPMTSVLDTPWYQTPNIHFCTIRDFQALCRSLGIRIERRIIVGEDGRQQSDLMANLLGAQAVFLLSKD